MMANPSQFGRTSLLTEVQKSFPPIIRYGSLSIQNVENQTAYPESLAAISHRLFSSRVNITFHNPTGAKPIQVQMALLRSSPQRHTLRMVNGRVGLETRGLNT